MANQELRILASVPLSGDAMARAKQVAAFEAALDVFGEAVARAGGTHEVEVVTARLRKGEAT